MAGWKVKESAAGLVVGDRGLVIGDFDSLPSAQLSLNSMFKTKRKYRFKVDGQMLTEFTLNVS